MLMRCWDVEARAILRGRAGLGLAGAGCRGERCQGRLRLGWDVG